MGLSLEDRERAASAEVDFGRVSRLRNMSYVQLQALLAGDPARALPWLRSAAAHGLVEAQLRLGRMLLEGRGAARDEAGALGWFVRATRLGSAEAMNMVGRCHEMGWGVGADTRLAAHWYGQAADAGHDWGQYNLANLLFDGRGVARDVDQALAWYRRAAAQGHARAMNLMGRCAEEGWGGESDLAEAAGWYRRSAEAGYFRGQFNHGAMLIERGLAAEAAEWFDRAIAADDRDIRRAVAARLARESHPALKEARRRALALLDREALPSEAGEKPQR
jgi:uncharacterized protein